MIAVFTDFGIHGPYLGQMKAVLHHAAPAHAIVDVFPDLPPFNVKAAAYLLPAYSQYLPDGTVCVCVVDPGVGTDRRALVIHADNRWYVGPDNGLFSVIVRRSCQVMAAEVSWTPAQLSASFHGRDLFAPVAARIAVGDKPPVTVIGKERLVTPAWPEDLQEVVYIDSYGNAITGVRACSVAKETVIECTGRSIAFRRTFGEAQSGSPFWYENSNGLLEIAVANGHAARELGLAVGSAFRFSHPNPGEKSGLATR